MLTVLVLTSCRDDDPTRAYGELLFVQGDALLTDAVFTSPPAFMTEAMEGEVLVRNVGRVAAEIEAVTREGDTAFTLLDAEGMSFSSGAELPLRFRFAPPQAGDATAASVAHEAVFTLTLTGTAEDKSQLTLTLRADALARDCYVPALLNFGRVPTGHTVTAQVTLENGAALPSPTTWNNATTVFALPPPPLEVAAGSSAQLAVSFTPTSEGSFEETVTVSRGATCPEAQLQLTGVGDDEAITWSPSSLRFGRVPRGERKVMEVVFTNHSTVTLEVTASVSGDAFSLDDAPAAISGEGSAAVRVACQPDNLGNTTGTLTVNFGFTPPFIATVPLTCVGGGPRIRVTPGVFTFGQVPFNATGTAVTRRRLMVQNVGTAPEAPGDTQHNLRLGQSGALPWFAVVPRNAHTRLTEFEVGLVSSYDVAAGIPALPGENLVEFEVRLKPTTAEPREADLLVYSNDEIEPVLRIPLTAAPRAPEPCAIEVSDETVNFGPTPRGALVTRTVTLTNTSAVAGNQCLISGIELAPGSDLAFSVLEPANGALLIPSSQARTITVQADVPADAEYGDYLRGTLRFAVGNDGTLRTLPVAAQVSHCLLVDPPVLNLGVVQESCTSAPKPVTLYNLCSVPITVAPPAVPAPFIASTSPFTGPLTMAPGTTASMELSLAPVSAAQHQAVLTFTATQAGEVATAHVVLRAQSTVDGLQSDAFNQDAAAVDILFVIDDSCSMGDEQAKLASNFASFISAATQGTGDWRIAVTTTDLYAQQGRFYGNPRVLTPLTPNVAAAFANNVSVGTSGAGYEQPFACMGAALTSELLATHNAGFLRENAALAVVIVTDAVESSTGPVASYVAAVRAAKNNTPELVTVSVVGPFSPSGNGCSVEGVDDGRYAAIVQATGGTQADICATNWATSLAGVSQAVFGSRRIFTLSGTPNSANDITVTVDSAPVTTGWQWDHVRNAIVFEVPPTAGSELSISYLTACF